MKDVQHGKTTRKSFARINEILEMPNLIEVQKKSYQWFLDEGLREVFADTASITDYTGNLELSFLDYSMDEEPKYSVEECKARDATYASPLKVRMRLRNKETGEIKEQEIFMGDFPKMTDSATFIINGAERDVYKRQGFVTSTRGAQGGYQLARQPSEYTVGDILRITEGPLVPVACLENDPVECSRADECITLDFWRGLYDVVNQYVDSVKMCIRDRYLYTDGVTEALNPAEELYLSLIHI